MKSTHPVYFEPDIDAPIEPVIMRPGPAAELAERYEFVDTSRLRNVPLFRVVHSPRHPSQTVEQDRAAREDTERYYFNLSVLRCLAHRAADTLGFPADCRRRACRREHACMGERHEFDWSFPGPWMPPCASTIRLVDRVRERVRAYCRDAGMAG